MDNAPLPVLPDPAASTSWQACRKAPLTWLFLGYLAVAGAFVALFAEQVDTAAALLAGFGGCAMLMLTCAVLADRFPRHRWTAGLWIFCPLALQPYLYTSAERYATALRGRYVDADVIAWETWALGGVPNLALDRYVTPVLTEVMMASYFSYYLLVSVPALWLVARGRIRHAARLMFAQVLAHVLCYPGYLLVPLRGPVHALADEFGTPHLSGYLITRMQTSIMELDPRGTCFPSSHVAMSWAALLTMRRLVSKRVFRLCLVLVCSLTSSVVYCRYHYLSDVCAGLAVAVVAAFLTRRVEKEYPHVTRRGAEAVQMVRALADRCRIRPGAAGRPRHSGPARPR
ncbi:phosphatase PAP2 family protein [Nonomuraea sp. B19D2]|uniref:phosphatase PAP2 family protein n=1 Tax=Nonomuraea sp. B19D2 TaxID=3159561 RepID=UPI0032DAC5B2